MCLMIVGSAAANGLDLLFMDLGNNSILAGPILSPVGSVSVMVWAPPCHLPCIHDGCVQKAPFSGRGDRWALFHPRAFIAHQQGNHLGHISVVKPAAVECTLVMLLLNLQQ